MIIIPSDEILQQWVEDFVPKKDLFFLTEGDVEKLQGDLRNVLVMPITEFYGHTSYTQTEFNNSYEYWNIKGATHVIAANPAWIVSVAEDIRAFLLRRQVEVERGMVLPVTFFSDISVVPGAYIIEDSVVLQRRMWEELPQSNKKMIMKMVAEWWEDGVCEAIPEKLPPHLLTIANTYGTTSGANCLAAALFAVSGKGSEWLLQEWVHQQAFLNGLKQCGYEAFEEDTQLMAGDVVAWLDDNEVIQHAAYYIGNGLFFNKQGQTIFNAWKIMKQEELIKKWPGMRMNIYRYFDK
ncbi:hypothetical protein JFL43_09500 [Viridibacillus sp. YIM B01967]|uniref:NlpC/P60 domain-containing protein n=1 Tax=Viridibacillus soli TaxID=2798301 RepID=A0ABS1H7I9_9BACL|nr:hypothetical protein [Viridibacillus soli]MBK3495087.1 hypothetical protein [Viridibacillus soli]